MPSVRAIRLLVCSGYLVLACGGGGGSSGGGGGGGGGGTTTDQLIALKAHGIYFGHQSVGAYIMMGVDDLLASVPAADRLGRGDLAGAGPGVWADGPVESNMDPIGTLADFRSQMTQLCGKVDLAFMKLCYADQGYIDSHGAQSLYDAYRTTMSAVHTACPSATLVHFTMPITDSDNELIEGYNALVRAGFGSAVFDLAREESTLPDGSRCLDGNGVPILCAVYTDDHAHPNSATGQQRMAEKLIAFLASLD